jgi:periplasmic divalent cation tolerance protein
MNAIIIYMTCATEGEARRIVSDLLDKRLIACANISGPVTSLYRWKDKMEEGQEVTVIMKTRAVLFERVHEAACALHSYECPCIVSWPIEAGHAPFLAWIESETSS